MHARSYETRHAGGDTLATHRHAGAYAALVIDGGHVETSIDGPVACEPGTLLLHPRFHAHGNRFGDRGACVVNLCLPEGFAIPTATAYRIDDVREASRMFAHAALEPLRELIAAARPLEREREGGDWRSTFLQALREGDDPVGLIARRLGISAAYASRALLRSYGMGPQALRRELRWRRALSLLSGDAPLAEVAAQAGFADQSHFNRIARACSGMTPTQLRRQVKCVQDAPEAMAA